MVQSFNLVGTLSFLSNLAFPSLRRLLIPHLRVSSISQLNFSKLHSLGFRGVIFDKDNTITQPYVPHYFNDSITKAISEAER
jgi:phosphatidylglycerophosphatase GEP4